MPETLHVLHYDYVEGILEKRAPHREGHLGLLRELHAEGEVVLAGAVGDPPTGGLLVFRSAAGAEAFAARDPYVEAGLVLAHRVEPWTVVVGA
jgi:uncharacterized protein